jgi:hypothetical protein
MRFRDFITRDILPFKPHLIPLSSDCSLVVFAICDGNGDVYGSGVGVVISITELCYCTRDDCRDELLECPWSFGDEDCEEDFRAFAEKGTFRDETETGEVHVGS